MRTARLVLVACAVLALALPVGAAASAPGAAPDFTLKSLDGKTEYTLSELQGKVVYLDFWASWCGPCRRAFPDLISLHEEYKDEGFMVLAVSLDRKVEAAVKFMEQQKASFPAVFDEMGKIATRYGVRSIPTAFLIDAKGMVVQSSVGFDPNKVDKLKATIEELLADAASESDETKAGAEVGLKSAKS
jgi:thiol-disulfide isomerase/thioredoxin